MSDNVITWGVWVGSTMVAAAAFVGGLLGPIGSRRYLARHRVRRSPWLPTLPDQYGADAEPAGERRVLSGR